MAAAGWEALDRPDTRALPRRPSGRRRSTGSTPVTNRSPTRARLHRGSRAVTVERAYDAWPTWPAASGGRTPAARARRRSRRSCWSSQPPPGAQPAPRLDVQRSPDSLGRRNWRDSAPGRSSPIAGTAEERPCRGGAPRGAGLAPTEPDAFAQTALRGVLTSEPDFLGYRYIPLGANAAVAAVPHEDRMLLAVGTSVALVDPDTGESSGTFSRPFAYQELPSVLRVSADGTRAVQLLVHGRPPLSARLPLPGRLRPGVAPARRRPDPRPVPQRPMWPSVTTAAWWPRAVGRMRPGTSRRGTPRAGDGWPVLDRGASAVTFGVGRPRVPRDVGRPCARGRRTHPPGTADAHRAARFHEQEADRRRWRAGRGRMVRTRRLRPRERSAPLAGGGIPGADVPWVREARRLRSLGTRLLRCRTGVVEEHDIRTGELTGRVSFDPQFGRGGDLVVDRTPTVLRCCSRSVRRSNTTRDGCSVQTWVAGRSLMARSRSRWHAASRDAIRP